MGESRGKGNAETLLGENFDGLVVSDDYGVYRKLKKHQLCWAHLIRKFRDLAKSGELPEHPRKQCKDEYTKISALYDDLKQNRSAERCGEFTK